MSNYDEKNEFNEEIEQVLWVGIGCKRGTSWQLFDRAIEKVFEENNLFQRAIAGIATINTKASEVGLVEFCNLRNLPLKTFSAEVLSCVSVPNPSKITNHQVGTYSVAEAAAILVVTQLNPSLFSSTEKLRVKLLVPKQVFQLKGQPGAITLAVAQA
ncbi:cobalamin biosynthesis protein [Nostoc sp. C117]|uniref:cobalamin biosynthesis protein n=1 Tax=Nostoc sp. C117 TaxID=3349875 RepID=UPI00370D97B6